MSAAASIARASWAKKGLRQAATEEKGAAQRVLAVALVLKGTGRATVWQG